MKRFTDTAKWGKQWFQDLPPRLKCFWIFLCDSADAAGVWEPNFKLASFQIGEAVSEADLARFGDRLFKLENGKFVLTSFIEFQYGKLSLACKPHVPVFRLLEKHRLPDTLSIPYQYPINRVQEKDQDQEKEKEGDTRGVKAKHRANAKLLLEVLNESASRSFRATDSNLDLMAARLAEPEVTPEGCEEMIHRQVKLWKGTETEEYLQPSTLFGKQKFGGYYDKRLLPANGATPSSSNPQTRLMQ